MWKNLTILSLVSALWMPNAASAITATQIRPHEAQAGVMTMFWTQADAGGLVISRCDLYVGKTKIGQMVYDAEENRWKRGHIFAKAGTYELKAVCVDENNKGYVTPSQTITVNVIAERILPTVLPLTPSIAVQGKKTNFVTSAKDAAGLLECYASFDGARRAMTLIHGGAMIEQTFIERGGHGADVECTDKNGNKTKTPTQTILVMPENFTLTPGQLLKIACPSGNTDMNHPCRAVYFYGKDKKRHTFPNEHLYKSWYQNFNTVIEVPDDVMAGVALGKNAAYRPGAYLVKFYSSPRVYAVSAKGLLRPIASEQAALDTFGPYWKKMVVDLNDAFFSHYTVGFEIKKAGDYSRTREYESVKSLADNF